MPADVGIAIDLQGHIPLDAIEARLIRMGIGAERAHAAVNLDARRYAMVRRAIREVQVRKQNVVDPKCAGGRHFKIRDVCSVGQNVIARISMGAIKIGVRAAYQRKFFRPFYFAHVQQRLADVHPFNFWEHLFRRGKLVRVKLAVDPDFISVHAFRLDSLEKHLEQVHRLPLHNLPLFRKAAFRVLGVEILPTAAKPPALHQVAVQRRVEVPGIRILFVHEDALRALGVRVPVTGQINNVQLIARHKGVNIFLGQLLLEARHGLLVPFERQTVIFRRFRWAFLAGRRAEQQFFAAARAAALHDFRQRSTCSLRLHSVNLVHALEKAAA